MLIPNPILLDYFQGGGMNTPFRLSMPGNASIAFMVQAVVNRTPWSVFNQQQHPGYAGADHPLTSTKMSNNTRINVIPLQMDLVAFTPNTAEKTHIKTVRNNSLFGYISAANWSSQQYQPANSMTPFTAPFFRN